MKNIAEKLFKAKENIILIYAFNGTGKTRLSVAYKDLTKKKNKGEHIGVYYNAFSEDLFVWDNDEENDNENIRLQIIPSSLDKYIKEIKDEGIIREKLEPYHPNYDFKLVPRKDDNLELGWGSIVFFSEDDNGKQIKISRGEERIFVWCFYLALFEAGSWSETQNRHFFIDDPVSSLDDYNIFITADLILNLFKTNCDSRKIILTTHHMGLFSILHDWLAKGENTSIFKRKVTKKIKRNGKEIEKEEIENKYLVHFLEKDKNNKNKLVGSKKGATLYHLLILQILNEAIKKDDLNTYHFVLLRQLLESISSFLGKGRFSYVLEKLGFNDSNRQSDIINVLSHERIYTQKLSIMKQDQKNLFKKVFNLLLDKFPFSIS